MNAQRTVALALAVVMAAGTSIVAQQGVAATRGVLAGRATDEARQPYSDYAVQVRDAATGQVVGTQPLNTQGQFSFAGMENARRYLVELYRVRENRVMCTEGPFVLSSALPSKVDVNIECGRAPAALWLLAAGAGAAAFIGIATRSASQ